MREPSADRLTRSGESQTRPSGASAEPGVPALTGRWYLRTLGAQWRSVLALLGWSVLESVPALVSGRLVALAVDRGFAAGAVWTGLGWLALFGALSVLGALGSRLVFHSLGGVLEPLRDALVTAVVRASLHGGDARWRPADTRVVALVTRHVEVVRDVTAGLLVQSRSLLVVTVAALVGMVGVAAGLAGLVLVPVVVTAVLYAVLLRALVRRQRALVLAEETTAGAAGAVLAGLRDVVACGAEPVAEAVVRQEISGQAAAAARLGDANAVRTLVVALGGLAPLLLVLAVAPGMVADGRLSVGAVLGVVVYLTGSVQPALRGLAETTGAAVLRLAVTLRRLAEVPAAGGADERRCGRGGEPGRRRGPVGGGRPAGPSGGDLVVRGLTFGWGARAEPVVRDLDLTVPWGEHLAVVGPSGIGKSTLASLVTGLLPAERGEVLLGGVAVTSIDPAVRHRAVMLIPQEAYVFTGTVRENLALFAGPGLSDVEDAGHPAGFSLLDNDVLLSGGPAEGLSSFDGLLLAAARAVGAAGLVARLGGLDGMVVPGELSSGEAQLIALARVYASPAGVVVLDEATSRLDPAAEAVAERAFARRGGTLVVIAHRLSSAVRADRVLVMDGGPPVVGRHEELLATSPTYAELMRAWAPGEDLYRSSR
ncbi:ATP-binding cassette domain-containing protein [Goodfellowiella coeruleoviolacea]|uniref:ATP-binding cassette, subfamily C n=1 Tax=Goodfellowiella coeruleoviolacea TaxID=334858 RepID=A0AAE3KF70_9PSEU|nr:ATP-binding cassette domain-containing protein [Goodfellowiella coeruleoviolacea]MCP2166071.1 ATP-binding cassette, subfamily C [Goodfellowiella coeruleoviolacea]